MRFLLLSVAVLVSGCAAQMMHTTADDSPYAPVNESQGGQVRYLHYGFPHAIRARRADAYKQMHQSCGGRYRIVNESSEQAGSFTAANTHAVGNQATGTATTHGMSWRYIDFECVDSSDMMATPDEQ